MTAADLRKLDRLLRIVLRGTDAMDELRSFGDTGYKVACAGEITKTLLWRIPRFEHVYRQVVRRDKKRRR